MVQEAPVILTTHELETTFGVLFVGTPSVKLRPADC